MNRLELALHQLSNAVNDPGPRPDVHRDAVARLAREWPTLSNAIREVLDAFFEAAERA